MSATQARDHFEDENGDSNEKIKRGKMVRRILTRSKNKKDNNSVIIEHSMSIQSLKFPKF